MFRNQYENMDVVKLECGHIETGGPIISKLAGKRQETCCEQCKEWKRIRRLATLAETSQWLTNRTTGTVFTAEKPSLRVVTDAFSPDGSTIP